MSRATPLWVPQLSGAQGRALGRIPCETDDAAGGVALLPKANVAVLAEPGGDLRAVSLETGEVLWRHKNAHEPVVQDLSISRDGQTLASAAEDGLVHLWAATTGRRLRSLSVGSTVNQTCFSPDGQHLASAACDGSVCLWRVATGQPHATHERHSAWVVGVDWSPDGRLLASASNDGTVAIFTPTGEAAEKTLERECNPRCLAWHPEGKHLAVGWDDGVVTLHGPDFAGPPRLCSAHSEPVNALLWAAGGQTLVTGSDDQSLRFWDAATAQTRHVFTFDESYAWRLAWSGKETYLASSHPGAFRFWDTRNL